MDDPQYLRGTEDQARGRRFSTPEIVNLGPSVSFLRPFSLARGPARCPGSYVGEALVERAQDVVWRVGFHGQLLYVYLLLEFQSRSDRTMALRMLVYVGLLYQDLVRRGDVGPGQKLPPVLPLVLYNGERPWTAAKEVFDLVELPDPELERYAPRLRYLLLDVARLPAVALAERQDPVAALFRVEQARQPGELADGVERLLAALEAGRPELQRAAEVWLCEALRRFRLGGGRGPATILEEGSDDDFRIRKPQRLEMAGGYLLVLCGRQYAGDSDPGRGCLRMGHRPDRLVDHRV